MVKWNGVKEVLYQKILFWFDLQVDLLGVEDAEMLGRQSSNKMPDLQVN